jgi:hypothetical protein
MLSPCSSYVNRRFGGTCHFHLQGRKSAEQEDSLRQEARQKIAIRTYGVYKQKTNFVAFSPQANYTD